MIRAKTCLRASRVMMLVLVLLASIQLSAYGQGKEQPMEHRGEHSKEHSTVYRTVQVDGLSIFYREAGPKDAPTLLLLHGLPSSSRMFEPLFARLSDRYHMVAPDYPASDTATGPIQKSLRTPSITSPM